MDAVESMISKSKRKKTFRDSEQKTIDHLKNPFDCKSSATINSLAVNKNTEVKVTTYFFFWQHADVCKIILNEFHL